MNSRPDPGSVRGHLRASTAALHRDVDARMRGLAPTSSMTGYSRFLWCMGCALDEFGEAWDLVSRAAGLPECADRLTDDLRGDLAAIPREAEPLELSLPDAVESASLDRAFGVAYALEGSSMGARVLLREVQQNLGRDVSTSYLEGLVSGSGDRWPVFLKALEARAPAYVEAEHGARRVFERLLERLAEGAELQ